MEILTLDNPLTKTYIIATSIMVIKVAAMSWLTVIRMMQEKGGFRSPEDLKKTPLNPEPNSKQIEPNERVERVRRIHMNDLENVPFFIAAGFVFILTDPPVALAQWLLYGYAITRILHFFAYFTGKIHDIRAALWTPGSLIILFMSGWALWNAV